LVIIAWLICNASAVEAGSALGTARVALAALVGVKLQIDASDRAQALQTARAAHLAQQALSVRYPKYADPEDACALLASSDGAAYEADVTHLLFTAEQTLATQNGWEQTFACEMQPHQAYTCGNLEQITATTELRDLMGRFAATHCATDPACPAG
jgi:aminopeptidase N